MNQVHALLTLVNAVLNQALLHLSKIGEDYDRNEPGILYQQ
jgi:hypothetical protein